MDEWGSKNGAFVSEKVHCRGPRERAPLLGTLGYESKALKTGISLRGAQLGKRDRACLLGNLGDC
jgi:hypothetical protein